MEVPCQGCPTVHRGPPPLPPTSLSLSAPQEICLFKVCWSYIWHSFLLKKNDPPFLVLANPTSPREEEGCLAISSVIAKGLRLNHFPRRTCLLKSNLPARGVRQAVVKWRRLCGTPLFPPSPVAHPSPRRQALPGRGSTPSMAIVWSDACAQGPEGLATTNYH